MIIKYNIIIKSFQNYINTRHRYSTVIYNLYVNAEIPNDTQEWSEVSKIPKYGPFCKLSPVAF